METSIQIQTVQPIFQKIHEIRGQKVMLDFDLAELYGVETKQLNLSVKRNLKRFPEDFMFQLTRKEQNSVSRFQIETLKYEFIENEQQNISDSQIVKFDKRGSNIKYLPYAFTEQGIAMLSGILNSDRAISVNIAIMRVFVEMRKLFLNHQEVLSKVTELAYKVGEHDESIKILHEYLKSFDEEQKRRIEWENRKPIGFIV